MKEVITIPRPKKSSSQVSADTLFQAYNISDLENLNKNCQRGVSGHCAVKAREQNSEN